MPAGPYEQAVALAQSPDPADLLSALTTLDALGARAGGTQTTSPAEKLGVTRIPRGRVQSTRDNPAAPTERQSDVVRLLAEGLTNAEIAAARAKALGLLGAQAGPSGRG